MTKQRKLMFILSIIISIVMLSASFVIAWSLINFETEPIIIQTGTLEADVTFFQANDTNLDGILDGGFTEITEGNILFATLIPGQIYTFRLIIENIGSIDGELKLSIFEVISSQNDLLDSLDIKYINPITTNLEIIAINSANITLFEDYVLQSSDTLTFDFTIEVKTTLNSLLSNEQITISAFEVRLDQIIN
jgi:hypothetical protein